MIDPDELFLRHLRRESNLTDANLAKFMAESNAIEDEDGLNPNDLDAARLFLRGPMGPYELLACHGTLAMPRGVDWGGRYRDCNVRVGGYVAPRHADVPSLMAKFFRSLPKLDAWTAHNRFQKIHPFEDLNGRTGRLIWLHKALDEGYDFRLSFLHKFYYQTLERQKSPGRGVR